MGIKFKDNALTVLAAGISAGATTLTVPAGKGDNFPAITGAGTPGSATNYFYITLENASGQREVIKCEHRQIGTDTLGSAGYPLIRNADGLNNQAWLAGDSVDLRLPAYVLELLRTIAEITGGTITGLTSLSTALLTVGGISSVAGASGSSLVLIQSQTAAASASIDFTTGIDATYNEYVLAFTDVVLATNDEQMNLRISLDGGATFKAGAADYQHSKLVTGTTGTPFDEGSTGDTIIKLMGMGQLNADASSLSGVIRFFNPAGTAKKKVFLWDLAFFRNANPRRNSGYGCYIAAATAINGVRLLAGSGNITSGTFALYGVRKS